MVNSKKTKRGKENIKGHEEQKNSSGNGSIEKENTYHISRNLVVNLKTRKMKLIYLILYRAHTHKP